MVSTREAKKLYLAIALNLIKCWTAREETIVLSNSKKMMIL
jgi:hypothetical protein